MKQIALLGFGVVGSGTAEVLTENQKHIAAYCKDEISIKYILDLRDFPDHPLGDRVVHDVNVILLFGNVLYLFSAYSFSHFPTAFFTA